MLSDATSSSWTDILSLSHSSYEFDQMPERPYKKSKTDDAAAEAKEVTCSFKFSTFYFLNALLVKLCIVFFFLFFF